MRFIFILLLLVGWAQAKPKFPALNHPVIDMSGLLPAQDRELLSRNIYEIHAQGGPQIGIMITNDLQGYAIEDYSIRLAEAWQLGGAKKDNGLIIVIAPQERKLQIEVGAGIEGDITDLDADKWIRHILTPAFQKQQFSLGLNTVLKEIGDKFGIKLEGRTIARRVNREPEELSPLAILFILLIFFIVLPILHRAQGRINHYPRSSSTWGSRGGFGGGSGGWRGGGGGFSGGGASGGW
jgi:uncharacterized protein